MRRTAQLLFAVLVVALFAGGTVRTWKDKSGKYNLRAELVKYENARVYLKRESDGRTISLAMKTLSRYDQIWVRKEMERRKGGGSRPPRTTDRPGGGDSPATPSASTDWPQWRGQNRDGKSLETGLLSSWPSSGPAKLWSATGLGSGYASVAVVGDRIYTMGKRGGSEYVICLEADSGRQVWATTVGTGKHCNGTPTVDGNRVYGIGYSGDLVCVSAADGREVWRKDFARDYGGKMMSEWGFAESPLVDGEKLVCTPGGTRGVMVALNKESGGLVWASPMPAVRGKGKDGAGYSSIVVSNGAGVKQYVQLVGRGLIGVDAQSGRLLWGFNDIANDTANIPTPLVAGDFVFGSTAYGGGSALLKLTSTGGRVRASEVYVLGANQMQNHHGCMILHEGYIYCGHGQNQGFPLCIQMSSGRATWGPLRGPGEGSAAVTYADGHLYYRYESGVMALIEANPREFRLKGKFKIATNADKSWSHPVISDGKLYLRDQDNLHCYNVRR
jgi:outer membrane protein assembly factor BamB